MADVILSHKHKFIFIKGHKVAGTSVEIALTSIAGPDDIVTPFGKFDELTRFKAGGLPQNWGAHPEDEAAYFEVLRRAAASDSRTATKKAPDGKFGNHMTLAKLTAALGGALPEGYLIFAVDRHPYSKIISRANMSAATRQRSGEFIATADDIREALYDIVRPEDLGKSLNLQGYLAADGSLPTRVLRYENLAEEFAQVMRDLNVENPPVLPHAKKGGLFDPAQVRDFMTPKQIALINKVFAREFETYGYQPVDPEG